MVKLNLLTDEKIVETRFEQNSFTDENEIQLEEIEDRQKSSPQIEFQQPVEFQEEPAADETVESITEPSQAIPTVTSFKSDHDTDTNFEQSFNSKKLLIILAAILGIILIGFVLYQILGPMGDDATPTIAEAGKGEASSTVSKTNSQLSTLFDQNQKDNLAALKATQQLFNLSSATLNYSIIIISPSLIQFAILANSDSDIDAYRSTLKANFPTSQIRMVNKEITSIGDGDKILADFSLNVSNTNAAPPMEETREIDVDNISDSWRTLSKTHKLTTIYFNKGKQVTNNQVKQILFYSTLTGTTENLVSFINEVTNYYPAINFAKISFNPSDKVITPKGKSTARITILLNQGVSS
jgi:hypothetical protein